MRRFVSLPSTALVSCAFVLALSAVAGACNGGSGGAAPSDAGSDASEAGQCVTPAPEDNDGGGGAPADGGGPPPLPDGGGLGGGDGGGPGPLDGGGSTEAGVCQIASGGTGCATETDDPAIPTNPEAIAITTQKLGTNGRFCESCHSVTQTWSLNPTDAMTRFDNGGTGGGVPNATATSNDQLDALFRTNDGTTSPNADVSTPSARRTAYSMLLTKAVFRVGLPVPDGAEFKLVAVDDPYGFASAKELSLFRRTLPVINLRFETTVMWDGRETQACAPLSADLKSQANDATVGHAQASAPVPDHTLQAIYDREIGIYATQAVDSVAGPLDESGALGGSANVTRLPFYVGMNAFPGPDPRGAAFNPVAFTLYDAWGSLPATDPRAPARAAVARGQALFNTRTFTIKGVSGLNDVLGSDTIQGTCTSCHNTPNVGGNSEGRLFNTGMSDEARRTPDLPLYTLANNVTGEVIKTSDPGRALITGKWADIGRFKVPSLRALGSHPPYFHNGSAASIADVVTADDARFSIGLTDAEKSDLTAFLGAL